MYNILSWFLFVPYMVIFLKWILSSLALDQTKFSFVAHLYSYPSMSECMSSCNLLVWYSLCYFLAAVARFVY